MCLLLAAQGALPASRPEEETRVSDQMGSRSSEWLLLDSKTLGRMFPHPCQSCPILDSAEITCPASDNVEDREF